MAVDRVRFAGECVALVVADTREAAYDARDLIDVANDPQPAVVDEEEAIRDGGPSCTRTCATTSRRATKSAVATTSRRRAAPTKSCACASSTTV